MNDRWLDRAAEWNAILKPAIQKVRKSDDPYYKFKKGHIKMQTSDLIRLLADNPQSVVKIKLKSGRVYDVSGVSFEDNITVIFCQPEVE